MKKLFSFSKSILFLLTFFLYVNNFAQTVIFTENFESGTPNSGWETFYKNEDKLAAKPMSQAPKPLANGGNYVGWLQDTNASYTGSAVAVTGALTLKNYSIEADVYCYVNNPGGSAYTGLVVYADSSKKDFYKARIDFDASDRINLSGLKSDTVTFVPKFNFDFKGTNNPGIYPTTDGWHKLKIEVRSTSTTATSFWVYFNGTLLTGCPINDTISTRNPSGKFGLYSFQMDNNGIAAYFDNIVVTQLPTSVKDDLSSPDDFTLLQNYPNPFNPSSTIRFKLTKTGFVTLKVFDVLGNEISKLVNENKYAGTYEVDFNGNNLSSGIYFAKLITPFGSKNIKMILEK